MDTLGKRVLAAALIAFVLLSGCAKRQQQGLTSVEQEPQELANVKQAPQELTILCGGSFRPPMEEVVGAFREATGIDIELSFGQSEDLLPQIEIGKQGDLFVSHDPYLDYVKNADALLDSVQVGFLAPALVVREGNPANVRSIEDLARPGVRVALPNPEFSTCGKILERLLEKKGIKEAVFSNAHGAVFRSHSEIGATLELGTRDAGIMWNGTAHGFLESIEVIPTPDEYDETIRVHVMGLSYSEDPDLVKRFLRFCQEKGAAVFAAHGYAKAPP